MHKVIYAIVEASTKNDALTIGNHVFNRVVNGQTYTASVFDYYVCSNRDGLRLAASDRSEDIPPAAPVDSEEGQQMVERAWTETRDRFEQHLVKIRQTLETRSDEQILNDVDDVRKRFRELGVQGGLSILLYNEHGTGIRTQDELNQALAASDNLWIVSADVYY